MSRSLIRWPFPRACAHFSSRGLRTAPEEWARNNFPKLALSAAAERHSGRSHAERRNEGFRAWSQIGKLVRACSWAFGFGLFCGNDQLIFVTCRSLPKKRRMAIPDMMAFQKNWLFKSRPWQPHRDSPPTLKLFRSERICSKRFSRAKVRGARTNTSF